MILTISHRLRAVIVGILIIAAYSMLVYDITKNKPLGVITDVISGIAVISIAFFMLPIFNPFNKKLSYVYLVCKFVEGTLMIIGGFFILNPILEGYRAILYKNIHIYFFILGALFFYMLLFQSRIIPKFISVWGIMATTLLLAITVIKLFGLDLPALDVLLAPMITNELFLAFWLIFKGFTNSKEIKARSQAA